VLDAVPRQALQIEIAAARAMREARERYGDASGVEAFIAGTAAPRAQAEGGGKPIGRTAAARAKAISASTLWTNHLEKLSTPRICGQE
jgi:hypothetical protein